MGESVADDPGSVPAPRSRRRRRYDLAAASETSATPPTEAPTPAEPDATLDADPTSRDETPLPTFVHGPLEVAPGAQTDAAPLSGTERHVLARPVVGPADQGWLPMLDGRSDDPETCPFLRAADEADRIVVPIEAPDPANRCAALRDPVPQSLRQQELVCLASGHVNCPRYLRGAVVIAEAPPAPIRPGRGVSPAVIGSVLALIMAASASLAFVLARGGLELTAAAPTPSPIASQGAVAQASATPEATPIATASPTRTASPSPTPTPTPTPSPTVSPPPTVAPTARPAPTSDRYALLRPCPGTPRCWIYRVRAGDNIYSIANYFGISQDSIYDRNPLVRNGLRPGQDLRLPPPTR